jgi:DNA repair protein RadA/Sms
MSQKTKTSYRCEACGYHSPSYLGKCPECQGWGSLKLSAQEHTTQPKTDTLRTRSLTQDKQQYGSVPQKLSEVVAETTERFSSGFAELDRVLGGGIIPGSYLLIGGDPGIGKSTLMLQVAALVSKQDKNRQSPGQQCKKVLYVAGEESVYQIKLRAARIDADQSDIEVLAETNIERILKWLKALDTSELPDLMIVDSIQSLYCPDVSGTPSSISQIKECAALLMDVAKQMGVPVVLIGHVTKDGSVSGPKLLEHTVDAVLYFEGDQYQNLRIIRTVKNRFGSTQEIGVFEMSTIGLQEVKNPSRMFMSQGLLGTALPGSVITAVMEGSRPILVELQALVGQSAYASPRRVSIGLEQNRLHQIIAVLERRVGLDFSKQDVYVNVVGGLKVSEPGSDLAIALAIVGSYRNIAIAVGSVVVGEIGLTGEIRAVRQVDSRIAEAERIGFTTIVLPLTEPLETCTDELPTLQTAHDRQDKKDTSQKEHIILQEPVKTILDAIQACFRSDTSFY